MAKLTFAAFTLTALSCWAADSSTPEVFDADDECLANNPDGSGCALSALQLRGVKASSEEDSVPADADSMGGDDDVPESLLGENMTEDSAWWNGWSQGGDKVWGRGTGIEIVDWDNVDYYNRGMDEARRRCGGPGCALIVNPPEHRSKNVFHIHFVHYKGYGHSLKRSLEARVCGRSGWHHGHMPCHGKAAFFPGFPGIFSKALDDGSIRHASLIAWPEACHGEGTIVEVAYGCSIEHQIRGDYNPSKR